MISELDYWLTQLEKEPIENSMAIFDIKFEYPKYLDVYFNDNGLVMVWLGTKIPEILLHGDENSIYEILKNQILPYHKQLDFVFIDDYQKNMLNKNFQVLSQTKLDLFYLNHKNFNPYANEKVERLNKKSSRYIRDYWEFAKTIKDPMFFDRRMESGYFYGIVLDGEVVSVVGSLGETEKTVVLGMFFTRPEFRGKHYGLACASIASEAILESNRTPICYVENDNIASKKIWQRLGYQKKPQNYYFITVKSQ